MGSEFMVSCPSLVLFYLNSEKIFITKAVSHFKWTQHFDYRYRVAFYKKVESNALCCFLTTFRNYEVF